MMVRDDLFSERVYRAATCRPGGYRRDELDRPHLSRVSSITNGVPPQLPLQLTWAETGLALI